MSIPSDAPPAPAGGADPFATAGLRRVVLDAWRASPDRFREDANAEEDAALGAYRDRVVVELAQNAADAAARAGTPGRLLLRLVRDDAGHAQLLAANTGAPLDAAGVRALASLRASAKRDDASTGRFGVGATSVLSVADDVVWASTTGAVRFSAASTRAALAELADAALDGEVTARRGAVPVMRLPFPVGAAPEPGYDTAVVLELRDDAAVAAVDAALAAVDDALLLALPALAEVRVERPGAGPLVLRDVGSRWHLLHRSGALPAGVLAGMSAGLGVEERARAEHAGWSLTWALPRDVGLTSLIVAEGSAPLRDDQGHQRQVLHAPTPTDDALTLPALLVAHLPLGADRRRVPDTPAARAVLEHAGTAYAELLVERAAAGDDVLPLVPTGLAAGWVDGVVRTAALAALQQARVLLPIGGEAASLRPDQALVLADASLADDLTALRALAPLVGGLVAAPREARAALAVLGVRRVGLSEVAEALPSDPQRWLAVAAALARAVADPAAREELAALRVPLADGRSAVGARGLLLPMCGEELAGAVSVLAEAGLRLVDPLVAADAAAERLLLALGARAADARDLLADPVVLAAVSELGDDVGDDLDDGTGGWVDDGEVAPLAAAVLDLAADAVRQGRLAPGDLPGLAELPLPSSAGEVLPAAALVVPGSPAAALLDPEEVAPAHSNLLERWGADALTAVGAASALGVVRSSDVDPLDPPDALADLAGAQEWFERIARLGGDGCAVAQVDAVRDLDLLRAGAEADLLGHLAAVPAVRAVVVDPVRVVRPDGSWVQAPSLSAWWLGQELGLRGCAAPWCPPGLAAVLPPPAPWAAAVEEGLGAALGLVADPSDLVDADGWQRVLDHADDVDAGADDVPDGIAAVAALLALWRALATAAGPLGLVEQLRPPARVLALDAASRVVAVPAGGAVVADDPCWAQRTDLGALMVPGEDLAAALADVVDISLCSERAAGTVESVGELVDVPEQVRAVLPGCPGSWVEHDELRVDGRCVDWWVTGRGSGAAVHAATGAGLARGLALAAGRWADRGLVEAVLADPRRAAGLLVEDAGATP